MDTALATTVTETADAKGINSRLDPERETRLGGPRVRATAIRARKERRGRKAKEAGHLSTIAWSELAVRTTQSN